MTSGRSLQAQQGIGIGAVVLFLGGLVIAGQVEKFGAIQPDALGAAAKGLVDLVREIRCWPAG